MKTALICALCVVLEVSVGADDACPKGTTYEIFSNASYSEESGDVSGFELALKTQNEKDYEGLLYVYEGTPNKAGISLRGSRKEGEILLEGDWNEDLIEYPSKRHIVQTRHVKISGRMSHQRFKGRLWINSDLYRVSLGQVSSTWLCKHD